MKANIILVITVIVLIGGVFVLSKNNKGTVQITDANNVTIVDGKQIIEIHAKGGYQPRTSVAKIGMPTILRFVTNGTFDCSSSIRIPSLGIGGALPPTGSTDIDIGISKPAALQGMCGMGMFPFEVDFQN